MAIIISLLIESFICNFPAFRTMFTKKDIESNFKLDNNTIMISNINERITSINIYYKNDLTDKITYNVKYMAEDTSDVITLREKILLENDEHYIHLDTHTLCQTLQIDLFTETEFEVEKIVLNQVNFNFNFYRMLFIFLLAIFFIKVRDKSIFEVEYDENSKIQNYSFILNLITACMFIFVYIVYQYNFDGLTIKPEEVPKDDSVLMQAEALVNGQIELMEKPSEELKKMENPYNHIKRDSEGIGYLYDVAYYDGAYYNYFGIAPIAILIVPFRILTGTYLHTYIFNFVFILGIALSLYFLYRKLINKYINKISLCNFYLGYYAILFGSNVFTLLRGAKYDIVVTSGIMFLLISMNLALSLYDKQKWTLLKLIFLGITTGLIVLSKPNLIVYYPLILLLILISMKEIKAKDKIKDGIIIAIPLAILAIFQMILNYVRFDNILEFGAKYQLTSFNMTSCMSLTFGKAIGGILEYVLKTPIINPLKFPFVFVNKETSLVSMNEVCYENRLVGLIGIAILVIYLFKNYILKDEKEMKKIINTGIIVSILGMIVTACFGGICEAYSVDFKLILCLGAVLLFLKAIDKDEENEFIKKGYLIACLTTIIMMVGIGLTTEMDFLTNYISDVTVFFKNIFEFWI
ncbi:MAG: hypothetical protein IKL55_06040 [Clostridia bacterium]|nr:hypothetical protein [Clostridia bacterium]